MVRPAFALALALVTLSITGCHKRDRARADIAPARIATIGVNSWLWRAALETLAFMPITEVDSNGGVIVTDWYANPRAPGERVKVSVFILDTELRADAIRVATQRQTASGGQWIDAPVQAGTVQRLEETILGRARDMRRAALEG